MIIRAHAVGAGRKRGTVTSTLRAEIAERDAQIERLQKELSQVESLRRTNQRRQERYGKWSEIGSPCACGFDDDDNQVNWCAVHSELRDQLKALREALTLIASASGKTLLGDGRYDEGANAAFEQMADIAKQALDATAPKE